MVQEKTLTTLALKSVKKTNAAAATTSSSPMEQLRRALRQHAQSSHDKESHLVARQLLQDNERLLRCVPLVADETADFTNVHARDPELAVDEVAKERVSLNGVKFLNLTDHGINLDFVDTVQELCVRFCETDGDASFDDRPPSLPEPHELFDRLMLRANPAGVAVDCYQTLNRLLGSPDHILLPTYRQKPATPGGRGGVGRVVTTRDEGVHLELELFLGPAGSGSLHAHVTCRLSFGIYRKRDLHDAGITGKSIAAMKDDIRRTLETSGGRVKDSNRNAWVAFDVEARERVDLGKPDASWRAAKITL